MSQDQEETSMYLHFISAFTVNAQLDILGWCGGPVLAPTAVHRVGKSSGMPVLGIQGIHNIRDSHLNPPSDEEVRLL